MAIATTAIGVILGAIGGGAIGALSRQPEINRMKAEIRALHNEIEHLNEIQSRALDDCEILMDTFMINEEKLKLSNETVPEDIKLAFMYSLHDYLLLKKEFLIEHKELKEEDADFVDSFKQFLDDSIPKSEDGDKIKRYISNYIYSHHEKEIENGIKPDLSKIIDDINETIEGLNSGQEAENGTVIPEFKCFTLSEYQTRLLFSLELHKANCDCQFTKDEKLKDLKYEWIRKWEEKVKDTIGISANTPYFLSATLFDALKEEYEASDDVTWYYVVMLETILFSPYFDLSDEDLINRRWSKLKYTYDYGKKLVEEQKIVDLKFINAVLITYNNTVNKLTNKTIKAICKISIVIISGGASAIIASALAPAIAVSLVGSQFAGIYGAALTNASLAALGGGTLAAGGAGMAGGQLLITGGAAFLGASTSGASTVASAIILATSSLALREVSKLVTSVVEIIINKEHKLTLAETIKRAIDKKIEELDRYVVILKAEKNDERDTKKLVREYKKSIKYLQKASKIIDNEIIKAKKN